MSVVVGSSSVWAYFEACLSAFFCRPPGALKGGGSIAPSSSFDFLDFSDRGLRGMSVSGKARGDRKVTSDPFERPSSVGLRPI